MKKGLSQFVLFGVLALLSACGSKDKDKQTTSGTFGCDVNASVVSGSVSAASASVVVSNLTVAISNGQGGDYTISLPNGAKVTTANTSYTYPSNMTLVTGPSGGISTSVSVKDAASDSSTSCVLVLGSSVATTGSFEVTPSPSASVALGSPVTLTVNPGTLVNPVFSFALSAAQTGVTLSQTSNVTATVTSTVATSVTVVTSLVSSSSTVSLQTKSTVLTFGSSTGTGNITVTASPSTSAVVGGSIGVLAYTSAIPNPVYNFTATSSVGYPVGITYGGNGFANVTSAYAATVTVTVTAYSATNTSLTGSATIILTFGSGSTGTGSISCSLSFAPASSAVGQVAYVYVTSATDTLKITNWSPGEAWTTGAPSFPLYSPLAARYDYAGWKFVQIWAESTTRPGYVCNAGQPMQAWFYVSGYYY